MSRQRPQRHPHDLELVRRWRKLVDEQLRLFLREQNFGDAYLRSRVAPLHDINETWVGATFEFEDPKLQRPFRAFLDANSEFCALLVERTHVMDTNMAFCWPKTAMDQKFGPQKTTLDPISRLNALARALNETIDTFDRATRSRIRVPIEVVQGEVADNAADKLERARQGLAALAADRARGGVPQIVSRPCLVIRIAPFAAQEGRRLDPRAVENAQPRFPPDANVRVEESSDARQWWSCQVPEPIPGKNPETRWLVRLVRPGLIEAEVTIGYREGDDEEIPIDGFAVEQACVSWTERLSAAIGIIGLEGPALIELSLDGVEDVVLQRARPGGKRIKQSWLFLGSIEVPDLAAPLAPAMHEAFDILWQSAGWRDGSPSFYGDQWSGYGREGR